MFYFSEDAVRAKQWTECIGLKETPIVINLSFVFVRNILVKSFFSRHLRADLLNLPIRLLLHPDAVPNLNVLQPIEAVLQGNVRSPLLGNYLNLNLCLYM